MGRQFIKIFNNFPYAEGESKDNLTHVLTKFDAYFEPKKLLKKYIIQFQQHKQEPHESIPEFITAMRTLAGHCEFGYLEERQIVMQLSNGLRDSRLREKLWDDDLSLDEAIKKCMRYEQAQETRKLVGAEAQVHMVQGQYRRGRSRGRYRGHSTSRGRGRGSVSNTYGRVTQDIHGGQSVTRGSFRGVRSSRGGARSACGNCATQHGMGQCPAYNKTCNFCGCMGHFESSCRKKKRVMHIQTDASHDQAAGYDGNTAGQNIQHSQQGDLDDFDAAQCESLTIYMTTTSDTVHKRDNDMWCITLQTEDEHVKFHIDTQAECTVLTKAAYDQLKTKPKLMHSDVIIHGYGGASVHALGKINVHVKYKGAYYVINCEIVDREVPIVLSKINSVRLNLVKRVNLNVAGKGQSDTDINTNAQHANMGTDSHDSMSHVQPIQQTGNTHPHAPTSAKKNTLITVMWRRVWEGSRSENTSCHTIQR